MWIDWLEMAAVVAGVFFMFVSSLGVFRLPDFYARIHAPTKAATLGLACLLAAVAMEVPDGTVATKAVLVLLFIGLTAPVGAHLLARTAYRNGVRAASPPRVDEYAAVVQHRKALPGREPTCACDLD